MPLRRLAATLLGVAAMSLRTMNTPRWDLQFVRAVCFHNRMFGSPCDNEEGFEKMLKLFDEYFKQKAQGGER